MSDPNKMISNTVKMRGLGQDDPIEWDAFGTSPRKPIIEKAPFLSRLLGPMAPGASASTGAVPQGESPFQKLMMKMIMMGWNPEGEQWQGK